MLDESLYVYMNEMLREIPTQFTRYKSHQIDWESQLVGITGPCGVGKSTMLLQYIKCHQDEGHHLYVSADHIYFTTHTLVSLADDFVKDGETFFYNQMRVENDVIASRESDFKIDKYTFEVGGKNKGKKQIENVPDAFIVKDDIEYGHGIILPLWHFGFNY